MLLGALLSAGVVLAQAPDQTQQPSAPQAAQNQQGRHHRAPDPDRMAKHLGKKLGLSNEQVAQLKPILEDRQQQMQTLRGDTSLNEQDRHARATGIMQDSKTRIEALLNDTQKQQFEQMLHDRRARHNSPPQTQ
jgi:periplasmic protein CpxP/Spy